MKAVSFIKEEGKITNKEYQEMYKVKKRQATNDLKELIEKGIFERVGATGRGTYYIFKGASKGQKGH